MEPSERKTFSKVEQSSEQNYHVGTVMSLVSGSKILLRGWDYLTRLNSWYTEIQQVYEKYI